VIDTNQPPGSIVIENFEAPSYAAIDWTTTGNFVGAAPLTPDAQGRITLQILVDWSSVEVFARRSGRHDRPDLPCAYEQRRGGVRTGQRRSSGLRHDPARAHDLASLA
jgi:Glycosyl hydrolases family 32 C terminal